MSLTIDEYLKLKQQFQDEIAAYLVKKKEQFQGESGIEVQDIFVYSDEITALGDKECHLIEDWEGIEFEEGEVVKEQPYSEENATKLFHMGDLGWQIWGFVKSEAEKIQKEANQVKEDVLGKSEDCITIKPSNGARKRVAKSTKKSVSNHQTT